MDRTLKTRLEARLGDFLQGPVYQLHDETEIRVKPGAYRVIRQREYSPEAIRNVAD